MKNRYEFVDSETVKIWLQERDGIQLFALVSPEDFDTVASVAGTWYADLADNGCFYAFVNIKNEDSKPTRKSMHRLILGLGNGRIDKRVVDHVDRTNTLDNRRSNLRLCPGRAENAQNVTARRTSTSGYRGVGRRPNGKWQAQVCLYGKVHYLGVYDTPEEAAVVSAEFRRKHMPFSADDHRKEAVE